jgi:hypothetical protein
MVAARMVVVEVEVGMVAVEQYRDCTLGDTVVVVDIVAEDIEHMVAEVEDIVVVGIVEDTGVDILVVDREGSTQNINYRVEGRWIEQQLVNVEGELGELRKERVTTYISLLCVLFLYHRSLYKDTTATLKLLLQC